MTPSTSTSCVRTSPARSRASSNRDDSRSSTSCRARRALGQRFRVAAQPTPQGELLDLAGRRTRELLDRAQLLGPLLAGEAGGVEVGAYGVEGRQLAEIG